ncbi:unnamed protein product [Notodromas monacha]|uniref:G-protein coupled receptors family 1 profile domain-containing protein n=1 Tax=Notodromas monacha TaxID=399045 RepID=A0A7R9GHF0_9CRUS|nr:unnamed protein product [Notodromas monacha]CAG0921391.1 unnamed protein product [Notodromas monacha]
MQPAGAPRLLSNDDHSLATLRRYKILKRAKVVSLKMTMLVVLGFLVCWTPYYIVMMVFIFWKPSDEVAYLLSECIFFFGMSNSLVNPLIYGLFHIWKKPKQPTPSTRRCRHVPQTSPHRLTFNDGPGRRQADGNRSQTARFRPAVVLPTFR